MTIHVIPTLVDNYSYAIETNDGVILIDCGDAAPVLIFLKEKNLKPVAILCTHHHWDHIDGFADLVKEFPDLKIYAPEKDRDRISFATHLLDDGNEVTLNGITFSCFETKGHTKHHLCYYAPSLNALFSGDTVFSMGCGRLLEGTAEEMFASLQKIKTLPDETEIYFGHEYTLKNAEFTLMQESQNPEIIRRAQEVRELRDHNKPTVPVPLELEKKTNIFLQAETSEKFAQLRKLRDHF